MVFTMMMTGMIARVVTKIIAMMITVMIAMIITRMIAMMITVRTAMIIAVILVCELLIEVSMNEQTYNECRLQKLDLEAKLLLITYLISLISIKLIPRVKNGM